MIKLITINNELSLEDYIKVSHTTSRIRPFYPAEVRLRIYPLSTEITEDFLSGFDLHNKRVMTMGSSLDQLFSYALLGSTDITIMDANNLTIPFFYMKLAALKVLSREEYIVFFYNDISEKYSSKFLDKEIYLKFKNNIPDKYRSFWDNMYSEGVINRLFHFYPSAADGMLPYYLSSDETYEYVRSIIDDITINITITDLSKFSDYLNDEYHLIDLSNVYTYVEKKKYWDAVNNLGNFLSVDGIFKLHYMEKNSIDEDEFNLLGKKSEYLLIRNINNGFIIWYNDERCYKEFHKSAPILK